MANLKLERNDRNKINDDQLEPKTLKSKELGLKIKLLKDIVSKVTCEVVIETPDNQLYKKFDTNCDTLDTFNAVNIKHILAGAAFATELWLGLFLLNDIADAEEIIELMDGGYDTIVESIKARSDTSIPVSSPFTQSKKGIS